METLQTLRPELVKEAEEMRRKSYSHEAIARMLSAKSGLDVSREVVRRWFAPDKPKVDEGLDGTGYVHD